MSSERWQRMNEIFERALDSPPQAREAVLRAACGDDEPLRRAVGALLRAHHNAGDFLEEPLTASLNESSRDGDGDELARIRPEDPSEDSEETALQSGRYVGPYRLLRQLGEGGMGTVFLASREDGAFERKVAIKVLRRGKASADTLRRLQAERQILAGLEHPYIARLYDGDATGEGLPYLVMEHVEGEPIDRYCDRNRLLVGDRIALFRKVCEAVDEAHRNLVVHRDLKPSNVLVTADRVPKLLDFGIAKVVKPEPEASDGEQATVRIRPLTPHYASPEQILGQRITTASDIYSLGVLLYQLLSGRLPWGFEGRTLLGIEHALADREPPRPSQAVFRSPDASAHGDFRGGDARTIAEARGTDPRHLARRLRGDLDHVVLKALRRDPEERYRSVRQLSEDLDLAERGFPVAARDGEASYRLKKFVQRNWAKLAVTALVMTLLSAFAIDRSVQLARLGGALVRAEQERDEKQQVIRTVVEIFRSADPTRSQGERLTVREALDQIDLLEHPALRISEGGEATLRETVGSIYFQLDLVEKAKVQLEKALEIRRRLYGEESLEVAGSLGALGSVLFELGEDDDEALAMLRKAIGLARRVGGRDHPELVAALNRLVSALCFLGDYEPAAGPSLEALRLARRHAARVDEATIAIALINRATVLKNRSEIAAGNGDLEQARGLFAEALEILRGRLGDVHPDVAATLNNLGDLAFRLGDLGEAGRLHRQALEVRRQLYPDGHQYVAQSLNHLGKVALGLGDLAAAEEYFFESMKMLVELRGVDHYVTTRPTLGLASVLVSTRRFSEAEDLLLKSLEIRDRVGRGRAEVVERLVELYEAWGRSDKVAEYRALAASSPPASDP